MRPKAFGIIACTLLFDVAPSVWLESDFWQARDPYSLKSGLLGMGGYVGLGLGSCRYRVAPVQSQHEAMKLLHCVRRARSLLALVRRAQVDASLSRI